MPTNKEKAEALLGKMDAIEAKLVKADTDPELAKKIDELKAEFTGLETEYAKLIEEAKATQARTDRRESLKLITDAPADVVIDDEPKSTDVAVTRTSKRSDYSALSKGLMDGLKGAAISDSMRDALKPKSQGWKDGAQGFRVPDFMAKRILGPMLGKAVQSDDADNGANLWEPVRVPKIYGPTEFETGIIDLVTLFPTNSGQVKVPIVAGTAGRRAGVSVSWLDEGDDKPETEPVLTTKTIDLDELAAMTVISDTMLARDTTNLLPWLSDKLNGAVTDTIETAIESGSGTGQPEGVVTGVAAANIIARETAGAVSYTDIVSVMRQPNAGARRVGAWFLDSEVVTALMQLPVSATDDRRLFMASMATGPYDRLIGKTYVEGDGVGLGVSGDVIFGDWKNYFLAITGEVVISMSSHRYFEKNMTAVKVFVLVGGAVVSPTDFAILGAASAS